MILEILDGSMTPGARLNATIEILETILHGRKAADIAMVDWAKSHRFAGSGDRRAVEARVYKILRRRNECAHAMHGQEDPRSLVLGSLALEGLNADQIDDLYTDGLYSPGALSIGARAALNASPASVPGPWVTLNYPAWLDEELNRSLGAELNAEMEAMLGRAALDVRANALKGSRADAIKALAAEEIEADASKIAPMAIRVRGHSKLEHLDCFRNGLIEVQDAASQATCEMLAVRPGERVVDLCAGAGGKSLAMAAMMQNQGTILACDVDGKRLGRLAPRAVRCGATMIELTGNPHGDHLHLVADCADAVLVDAPCSGSGTWRRNPEAKWTLDADRLESYRTAQAQCLDRAFELVRPDGRVLFVTCSVLKSEGEDQIDAAITRMPGLTIGAMRRFSPATTDTDGFFAGLLVKGK